MTAELHASWELIDGSTPDKTKVEVKPGVYDLERIPNPYGHDAAWLVLKGTKIGGAEGWWRDWTGGPIEHQIQIKE
jgi:hypothetical protein